MRNKLFTLTFIFSLVSLWTHAGDKYNFNSAWRLKVGDFKEASQPNFDDGQWKTVTLPHAFNEDEAFKLSIEQHTDTVVWYRKHFRLPADAKGKKVFIEFEGVRQAGDFYINGRHIGFHENGVMAGGFDLTPYIKYGKENVMAVRLDNNWFYWERSSNSKFQWNDRNFNANYGGLSKNVWLHISDKLYQTLPLYSNLKTTGVYIYAKDISIKARKATVHAESEVRNERRKAMNVGYKVELIDADGRLVKAFESAPQLLAPGETKTLSAEALVDNLHFWSWGYGYLYKARTILTVDDKEIDAVTTRTGFRKTRFANGKVWLNERVIQLKGFAQRTSNEWPGVGMSVPAWLSDFSNGMVVEGNGNLMRWMHITPWKQDVESADRVGLIHAMPAGDAEKDRQGRQWEQRTELMRDAIIYNRNNPSILFYECGNESISREHMVEMIAIRDQYDPMGGRAIGSREMLDIREAEYGGEMLYINKSAHSPMWAMEYCRDEALRKYWDEYSYPYHKDGDGNANYHSTVTNTPHKKKVDPRPYNRNQDSFTVENVIRWYEYWRERPGAGERSSAGGAKIIFSDSNTHYRGVENYRRSGDVDPMRIPKDVWFAHQVMWDGWVDIENPRLHIVGHWNYKEGTEKSVMVVANTENVELFLNGQSLGKGRREYDFLFTFDNVKYVAGKLEAVGYDAEGKATCRGELNTAGAAARIELKAYQNPLGWKADGADMVLLQVEVTDAEGRRCPLANDKIHFTLEGLAEWRGGIAQGPDNYILSKDLPVECGINRALIRSLTQAGEVRIKAEAPGLLPAQLVLNSERVEEKDGLSTYIPADELKGYLGRGETPQTPSYKERQMDVRIASVQAGSNTDKACHSFDDNELSQWKSDGNIENGWITYQLERYATIDEVCMKLDGWRKISYALRVEADGQVVWEGITEKSLGYIHLRTTPVRAKNITIRLQGTGEEKDAFGGVVELAAENRETINKNKGKKQHIGIIEIEFKEDIK